MPCMKLIPADRTPNTTVHTGKAPTITCPLCPMYRLPHCLTVWRGQGSLVDNTVIARTQDRAAGLCAQERGRAMVCWALSWPEMEVIGVDWGNPFESVKTTTVFFFKCAEWKPFRAQEWEDCLKYSNRFERTAVPCGPTWHVGKPWPQVFSGTTASS